MTEATKTARRRFELRQQVIDTLKRGDAVFIPRRLSDDECRDVTAPTPAFKFTQDHLERGRILAAEARARHAKRQWHREIRQPVDDRQEQAGPNHAAAIIIGSAGLVSLVLAYTLVQLVLG